MRGTVHITTYQRVVSHLSATAYRAIGGARKTIKFISIFDHVFFLIFKINFLKNLQNSYKHIYNSKYNLVQDQEENRRYKF